MFVFLLIMFVTVFMRLLTIIHHVVCRNLNSLDLIIKLNFNSLMPHLNFLGSYLRRQALYQGDKWAYCRFKYISLSSESSESFEESESEDESCMTSCSRLLCILTFLWVPIAGPNPALPPLLGSVPSCSPIVLRRMLCRGVMHGVTLLGVVSCVMFMFGVLRTLPLNGDLLALLYDFLTDLLLDFLDFVFFLMSFPFDLLRLLLFRLFLPLFLPLDIERRS